MVHQEMVSLVVKAPLAQNNVCARVLNSFNHVNKVVLFHFLQLFVVFSGLDLEAVFGLGLGWLEGAGEDDDLGVVDFFVHLGVGKLFVNNYAVNEHGVFDGASSLGDDLNFIEVHVASF